MTIWELLTQGDALSRTLALLLLAMSVASWVVILWKSWLLRRVLHDLPLGVGAFWQSTGTAQARERVQGADRALVLLPLIDAALALEQAPGGTLATAGDRSQQLTRVLRDALHGVLQRLQAGQVLLATVGSTAPFVGLLGTVWGIYHALVGMAGDGQITIDRIAGPVGEALIMTAAGLAVAIPAVLAYNWCGRLISRLEADLEGFARDLRELLAHTARPQPAAGGA